MNGVAMAKDLARVQPRALDAELDGYAWLPRMLDKARATLAGTSGSYLFGCPIDHTCMARLNISPELLLDLARRYADDQDVMNALRGHGVPSAREAWFDGQAVEDELQGPGWYLRVRPTELAQGIDGGVIELKPTTHEPPRISTSEEVVTVIEGEITFFLGKHQARTVRAGETAWVPTGVRWWFQNTGHQSAKFTRFRHARATQASEQDHPALRKGKRERLNRQRNTRRSLTSKFPTPASTSLLIASSRSEDGA